MKALSGVGYGEGCPLQSRLVRLREFCELPRGVCGGAPARNSVIFVNENGEKRENNEFVNEN